MDELQKQSMAAKARRAEAKEQREAKVTPVKKPAELKPKLTVTKPTAAPVPKSYPQPVSESVTTKAVEAVAAAPQITPAEIKPATTEIDLSVFVPGCRINHNKFGAGVITDVGSPDRSGEYMVGVKFDSGAAKRFMAPSAFIKRFLTKEED